MNSTISRQNKEHSELTVQFKHLQNSREEVMQNTFYPLHKQLQLFYNNEEQ